MGKIILVVRELATTFDESFKVTSVPFIIPYLNLVSC